MNGIKRSALSVETASRLIANALNVGTDGTEIAEVGVRAILLTTPHMKEIETGTDPRWSNLQNPSWVEDWVRSLVLAIL
jgi:hypothetical protein